MMPTKQYQSSPLTFSPSQKFFNNQKKSDSKTRIHPPNYDRPPYQIFISTGRTYIFYAMSRI